MSGGLITLGICVGASQPKMAPVPAVSAAITGWTNGRAVDGTTLTGVISGLSGGESIVHAWESLTDVMQGYASIPGAGASDLTIALGSAGFSDTALIRYAPFVDGVPVVSAPGTMVRALPAFTTQPTIVGTFFIGTVLQINLGISDEGSIRLPYPLPHQFRPLAPTGRTVWRRVGIAGCRT